MISIIFCSKDAPESDLLLKHVSELIDTMHFFFLCALSEVLTFLGDNTVSVHVRIIFYQISKAEKNNNLMA